ncbi:MAG: nucleotide sugar dehydrogenase [Alphaproteobacteria bacterium]|nr:nucleotide sugar dehydrogenase [Alphaproteobacteria bacterium]
MLVPANYPDRQVCIIGLGYVGLTLAVAMAEAGYRVFGVERDQRVLDHVRAGRAHFAETGFDSHLALQVSRGALTVQQRLTADMPATAFIVTVGTPVGADKQTQVGAIRTVCNDLRDVLKPGDLVVLRSTVRIGTTRNLVKPILDGAGVAYDIAFCPERTLEGKALQELSTLPQIVGGLDDAATFRASQLFSFLTNSVVRVSDLETAETIKLINNTQRDYIFAFANEVAAMCEAVGINAGEVISASNLGYPRANLPMPGPVGGPCLEKDPYILAEGLAEHGFEPRLSLAGRHWNEELPVRTIRSAAHSWQAMKGAGGSPRAIAFLGLAFKGRPETDDLRGSLALPMIASLKEIFPAATIRTFDPVVKPEAVAMLDVTACATLEQAFDGASLVIIQNNHEAFARMPIAELAGAMATPGLIYDYWNQHRAQDLALPDGIVYAGLGNTRALRDMIDSKV